MLGEMAEKAGKADIDVGKWDSRWFINVGIGILMSLGL